MSDQDEARRAYQREYYNQHRKQTLDAMRQRRQTPIGLLRMVYNAQLRTSKKRGHQPPTYTREQFLNRYLKNAVYQLLYSKWVEGGMQSKDKPSFDRLDPSKGYSFENIELTTWAINYERAVEARKNPVVIYKDGKFFARYESQKAATDALGVQFPSPNRRKPEGYLSKGYQVYSESYFQNQEKQA